MDERMVVGSIQGEDNVPVLLVMDKAKEVVEDIASNDTSDIIVRKSNGYWKGVAIGGGASVVVTLVGFLVKRHLNKKKLKEQLELNTTELNHLELNTTELNYLELNKEE